MRTTSLIFFSLFLTACANGKSEDIRIEDAWIAEIPPIIKVTAALMTIHNDGDKPIYLTGASSPNAASIEIHRSIVVDGLAKMKLQKKLEIPAHDSLVFSNDSGLHLMLYESNAMKAGNQIPISLEFKHGSEVTVNFTVRDRRAQN